MLATKNLLKIIKLLFIKFAFIKVEQTNAISKRLKKLYSELFCNIDDQDIYGNLVHKFCES